MPDTETPELIARRRDRVLEWVKKARGAVLSFQRTSDGSFWRDSKQALSNEDHKVSGTTTARCYMALVYADRCLGETTDPGHWKTQFREYASRLNITWNSDKLKLVISGSPEKEEELNHFEVAHVADLAFVKDYLERSEDDGPVPGTSLEPEGLRSNLARHFQNLTDTLRTTGALAKSGSLPMQALARGHFFVNLHAARAHAILGLESPWTDESLDSLKRFCLEQCFYAQRGPAHKFDATQLTLAGVACALFDKKPSVDLYEAIIDAIHLFQLPGGNWPATHPVFLPDGRPWHITSHEIALCLTWLYYVPFVPDASRKKLVAMMDRYFEQWVTRTYVPHEGLYQGWYDDHHIDDGYAVGWASAIVCHFLANYYWILSHEVNVDVIDSLGLQNSAEHYSFDGTAPELTRRPDGERPIWSDLPPYAWNPKETVEDVTAELRKRWTDPSDGQTISENIATKIIGPILQATRARPAKSRSSGILNGPPGTRKTSFVQRTAAAVQWPLVTVPGSVILANGWDGMEARATEVFQRLRLLTNCVIFFDEYEEFFRAREGKSNQPVSAMDSRTVAAFMTSGMLPRLQDLHDGQRCLVFLATNFPEVIDAAVRRAGRFDFNLDVQHPQFKRAMEYVDDSGTSIRRDVVRIAKRPVDPIIDGVKSAIAAYVAENSSDVRISFKNIEDALRAAARGPDHEAQERARRVFDRGIGLDAPSLAELD